MATPLLLQATTCLLTRLLPPDSTRRVVPRHHPDFRLAHHHRRADSLLSLQEEEGSTRPQLHFHLAHPSPLSNSTTLSLRLRCRPNLPLRRTTHMRPPHTTPARPRSMGTRAAAGMYPHVRKRSRNGLQHAPARHQMRSQISLCSRPRPRPQSGRTRPTSTRSQTVSCPSRNT